MKPQSVLFQAQKALSLPKSNSITDKVSEAVLERPQEQVTNKKPTTENIFSLQNLFDSIFRAVIRYMEAVTISNPLVRLPFRFFTEVIRNGTNGLVEKVSKKEKITKEVWSSGVRRSLENTIATIVFEPNKYDNRWVRVAVGFANMMVRLGARVLLAGLDVISASENIDELTARAIPRALYFDSTSPVVGIASRFAEQMGINALLAKMPIKNKLLGNIFNQHT